MSDEVANRVRIDVRDDDGATSALLVAKEVAHHLEIVLGLEGNTDSWVGVTRRHSSGATSDLADVGSFLIREESVIFRRVESLGVHDVGSRLIGEPDTGESRAKSDVLSHRSQ